ncbi:FecR family protein [soil metagenome]
MIDARSGVPGGQSAYDAHLQHHPEDEALAHRLDGLWDDIGRVPAPELRVMPAPARLTPVARITRSLPWSLPIAMAAGIAAVAFVSPFAARQEKSIATPERFAAGATMRKLTLDDGSTVTLAANSVLTAQLTPDRRNLTLEQGEAFFTVAHDKARPFVVATQRGETMAVGTAFDVRVDGAGAVVTVTEGKVRVTAPASGQTRYVAHDQQVRYWTDARNGGIALGDVSAANGQEDIAWTTGFLQFEGAPLADVIERVNAHAAHKLVLHDARLARMPIYANLKVG